MAAVANPTLGPLSRRAAFPTGWHGAHEGRPGEWYLNSNDLARFAHFGFPVEYLIVEEYCAQWMDCERVAADLRLLCSTWQPEAIEGDSIVEPSSSNGLNNSGK